MYRQVPNDRCISVKMSVYIGTDLATRAHLMAFSIVFYIVKTRALVQVRKQAVATAWQCFTGLAPFC
jgi:hypothetical protein